MSNETLSDKAVLDNIRADKNTPIRETPIRLTEYSHGAGCGCKIAPEVLEKILKSGIELPTFPSLIVGNTSRDDAAVIDIGNGEAIVSTTDFFMPIVDNPFTFGQIAAANAISDIYAMGGEPLMAIAILGWPVNKLAIEIAGQVIDGGRATCMEAGIPLAGGHSIDAPEPIFGLAVTGKVKISELKRNNTAKAGDCLFLTKPLGIGILSTAQKQKKLSDLHADIAPTVMKQLNKPGAAFAKLPGVHAMTDVTGFGFLGHLLEVCEGSGLNAEVIEERIPLLDQVENYRAQGCVPGGSLRNYKSYEHHLPTLSQSQKEILCDPQTSGGLLVAVAPEAENDFLTMAKEQGLTLQNLGKMTPRNGEPTRITII